jgi:hypothetical protein
MRTDIPDDAAMSFWGTPGRMTDAGRHLERVRALPTDVRTLAEMVAGLVLHEFLAEKYDVKVPEERRAESHVRPVEGMLDALLALDSRPLSARRSPDRRLVGVCRHFEVLFATALRAHGVPCRVRRGFGAYFSKDFEDHEVTEVWLVDQERWVRMDAQLDDVQRRVLGIRFDPLDVPRDQFIDASDAWQRCRRGELDAARFGIPSAGRGTWFLASNLIRDVAWLNKVELLPWDVWGAMPQPTARLTEERLAFFDRLAELTHDPDTHFAVLQGMFAEDERVRVPDRVYNALRNRLESIEQR